jgi:hypothetical protein
MAFRLSDGLQKKFGAVRITRGAETSESSIFERATTAQLRLDRATSNRCVTKKWARDTKRNAVEDRMRRFAQVALLGCVSALTSAALAFDNGQYDNVSPHIRLVQGGDGAERRALLRHRRRSSHRL